ncbi:porin [Oligella urethralis]|uniref:Porin domain-containing protein n=2 Tax=Oligella urethralis TaxID=90245 RepID=A0A096BG35_9BURK|nr:porin [Oligella urethralis]KGF32114.1 hypothetical protein HMPREF2130_01210 [Oligella urethralis DNF00040]
MNKSLLVVALTLGFAGFAQAESSVTLFGLVDAGYGFNQTETKFSGASTGKVRVRSNGMQDSVMGGSHWGLTGEEDLGNGTSAIFALESGFNLSDGTKDDEDRLFGNQAIVGLSGDSWGTFTIGRDTSVADEFVVPMDPFGTDGGFASAGSIFGTSLSETYDGTIKYMSPDFNGFQFGLGLVHSDSEKKTTVGNKQYKETNRHAGVTSGLGFESGPLYIGASFDYIDGKGKNDHPGAEDEDNYRTKTKAWNIGATYDFDVVKLHLLYGGFSDGHVNPDNELEDGIGFLAANAIGGLEEIGLIDAEGFGGKGLRQHSWLAGLSAPVGDAGDLMFSYAGNTAKNKRWNKDVNVKSHNFGLGYNYNLSKRTSVYGVASYGWSEAKYRPANEPGTKAKTTATQAVVGLQHRF